MSNIPFAVDLVELLCLVVDCEFVEIDDVITDVVARVDVVADVDDLVVVGVVSFKSELVVKFVVEFKPMFIA